MSKAKVDALIQDLYKKGYSWVGVNPNAQHKCEESHPYGSCNYICINHTLKVFWEEDSSD